MKRIAAKSRMSARSVKQIVNKEIKKHTETRFYDSISLPSYISVGSAQSGQAANQYLACLTAIPMSAQDTQARVAQKIRVSSIQVRMELANDSTLTTLPANFRVILFQWKPVSVLTAAASPSTASILSAATTGNFNYLAPLLPGPVANSYSIIYDKIHQVQPFGHPHNNGQVVLYLTSFGKYVDRTVMYSKTTSISPYDAANHFFIYVVSDSATAGAYPKMSLWARVRFTDS